MTCFLTEDNYKIDFLTSYNKSLEQKLKHNIVDATISVGNPQAKTLICEGQ